MLVAARDWIAQYGHFVMVQGVLGNHAHFSRSVLIGADVAAASDLTHKSEIGVTVLQAWQKKKKKTLHYSVNSVNSKLAC